MANKRKKTADSAADQASRAYEAGWSLASSHPLFYPLLMRCHPWRHQGAPVGRDDWATVTANGAIHVHPTRRGDPAEWAYVFAHCALHLGFGHFQERENAAAWNAACDAFIAGFLATLKFGRMPDAYPLPVVGAGATEEQLYRHFCEAGVPAGYRGDLILEEPRPSWDGQLPDWTGYLGAGLAEAVSSAVEVAAGRAERLGGSRSQTPAEELRSWFISSYPLLGALAASFTIIEDQALCHRLSISVAAVDARRGEIYINPAARLSTEELRFVMAHELLHVGLCHDQRRQGRDPFLWNIACDYVINGWLIEMGVGHIPQLGLLHDPELKGESAEAIYDLIVTDIRRFRKQATLRGIGLGDLLEGGPPAWWTGAEGLRLDEFYRRALSQGLEYHDQSGRGLLPAGLVEEIRALSMPPIPWDVRLARWFDHHFPPLEKVRSYARQSRRQAATPDIPRPRYVLDPRWEDGRTFGVILDTSGSMSRETLARALGAIASYSAARDIPAARVVFCDAVAYDQGYMQPEAIAGKVAVRGRGGTVLQPGVDLLERAEDFPEDGPLLIITDGECDRFQVRREHAFLLPAGRRLPFVPRGEVFYIE